MSAQVQFAYPITYISVHSHLDTHTHALTQLHLCLSDAVTSVEICMYRSCLSSVLQIKWSTIVYDCTHSRHTRVCKCRWDVERGACPGFLRQTARGIETESLGVFCRRAGQIISLVGLSPPLADRNATSAMMWYALWSVVLSVGAIFIITMIHLRTSHLQVLSCQACRMLFIPGFSPCLMMFDSVWSVIITIILLSNNSCSPFFF